MTLTTRSIIKILPFEEGFKTDLLDLFEQLDDDQKLVIQQILWDTYFAIYKGALEEKTQEAMVKAGEGKEKLDKEFYLRVEQEIEKEMQGVAVKQSESVDLGIARKAMELIIKEIRASKKKPRN